MPKITYIEYDGTARTVEGELDASVMETAVQNQVPGIVGECGGICNCATCVVHVEPEWFEKLTPRSDEEEAMLDSAFDVRPNSRLSCQIKVSDATDGLVVHTPAYQGR